MSRKLPNVGKSDVHFLDAVKEKFMAIGARMSVSKTRSKSTFSGYGVKITREAETLTAKADKGNCNER